MERVGLHVAGRFAGHLVVLTAVTALATIAVTTAASSLVPSGWVFVAPLAVIAGSWTSRRLRQTGEEVAIAQGGTSRLRAAWPSAVLTVAVQLALCVPGARTERALRVDEAFESAVAVDGSLLVAAARGDDRVAFHWDSEQAVPAPWLAAGAGSIEFPSGFVPEPSDRGRLRRQLFAVGTPLRPTGHPLDPRGVRWAWLAAGFVGVLLALGSERGRVRRLAPIPLVVVALVL